tara:strand:- start:603 stop:1910 length:1308 start_codon:yes stop_codon:yes gene_type:complete
MKLNRAKGTRDFLYEEKIVRNNVVRKIQDVFERYGFNPLETPVLERFETLSSKYAGGSEIMKETFKLKDQGGRELGLRYDLTVPLARVIAMNKGLRMPFKRYAIGRAFRDGPLKLGRYREFWQCDADIVGCSDSVAEIELLKIVVDVFKEIDVDVVVKINDRRVLDAIVEKCGVGKEKVNDTVLILDKLDKVSVDAVRGELMESVGVSKEVCDLMLEKVLCDGSNEAKMKKITEFIGDNSGLDSLKQIFGEVGEIEFTPALARGLTYYTGTIYEFFLSDESLGIKSSLGSGGRYDNLIGEFIDGKNEYPAVGISFGLDVITDVLNAKSEKENKIRKKTVADIYVISIGCSVETREIISKFRSSGLKTDYDMLDRGVSKNLEYASKAGIKYVVIVGKKELAAKKIKLKDMGSGDETMMTINECFKLMVEKFSSPSK